MLISLPLWSLIAVAIKREDGGCVFYRQQRVGRNGQNFPLLKFRSMTPNAEQNSGAVWAAEHDDRVTRFGRVLRATAMDELPQLWNILRGDMSFVGPRPERPELTEQFRCRIPDYDSRHRVRPGLTGVAQVYGRYDLAPEQKFRYEQFYLRRGSLPLDLRLITLSFAVTLLRRWEHRGAKLPAWLCRGRRPAALRAGSHRLLKSPGSIS